LITVQLNVIGAATPGVALGERLGLTYGDCGVDGSVQVDLVIGARRTVGAVADRGE